MIKLTEILQEIGDASALKVPYRLKYKYENPENFTVKYATYQFDIDDVTYTVIISEDPISYNLKSKKSKVSKIDVSFVADDGPEMMKDTNLNVQYKVMATLVSILKEYIENNPIVVQIEYSPIKTNKKDKGGRAESRRELFYKQYIQKSLPNWTYIKRGSNIIIKKPTT
jgi:hypothetical protein